MRVPRLVAAATIAAAASASAADVAEIRKNCSDCSGQAKAGDEVEIKERARGRWSVGQ